MANSDAMTPAEKAAVEKLRNAVSDVIQPHHHDLFMLKWLRVKNMDVNKAAKMFKESMAMRKKWNADTILDNFTLPEVLTKYTPYSFLGGAKDGTPVVLTLGGRTDAKGLCKSTTDEERMRCFWYYGELVRRELEAQSAAHGRTITQIILIEDAAELSFQQICYKPATDIAIKFIKMIEANFPDYLKAAYIINAPPIFKLAYKTVKPFLHENTKQRVHVYGNDSAKWMPVLQSVIDASQLPKHWGGTKTDPDGDPMCRSQFALNGKVPKSYFLKSQREALKDKDLTKVTVKNGDKLRLDFTVSEPGTNISWEFLTKDYSIGFGIQFVDGEVEDVVPVEIVESHLGVEDGDMPCDRAGQYTVIFDNTHNAKHSTKLSYNIALTPPSAEN